MIYPKFFTVICRFIGALLLAVLTIPDSRAQEFNIKNLVFEGAGMRGIAYAGVLNELESMGMMSGVEQVGGTSAGAITALLISLRYDSHEVDSILSNTEFQSFNDMKLGNINRMKNNFGWYIGDEFAEWLGDLIERKTGNRNLTFQELSDQGFLPLYTTATCITKQKLVVLSQQTYPNMQVIDAVRASMSIPLYFKAVFVDSLGRAYENYDDAPHLDILVDGGIAGNYPIFMFDEVSLDEQGREIRTPNFETLGFRIDSREQIAKDAVANELIDQDIENFKDYVKSLYIFTMETLNRNGMTQDDWARTVSISSEGIGPVIKKFSDEQKQALYHSGIDYTRRYFDSLKGSE